MVVDSNHDRALTRWLDEADYRQDPVNAAYFLSLQAERYQRLERNMEWHALARAIMREQMLIRAKFLRKDDSFVLKGIEHALHGDRGVDGRRGAPAQFAKMESKVTVGHTHSAGIYAGVYTVGTTSRIRLGYTHGPTTWSHTFCVLYAKHNLSLIHI